MIALVAVAGALGALARFVLDSEVRHRRSSSFPYPTVVINVTGSLVLGIVAGLVLFHGASSEWQAVIGTGFCGGYTTFSTASVETVRLAQRGRFVAAAANAIGSLVASVTAGAAGLAVVWAL